MAYNLVGPPTGSDTQIQYNTSNIMGASPNLTFSGSNLILTGTFLVTGGVAVSPYVQLLPVGTVDIPSNQTASYIYTSGSTNDLYFTQYQPGTNFTNTTRLRWLEGMLTTGLLHGGVLSTVTGSTTFSITSGSGIILTYNATLTTDPYPTVSFISWPTTVSQSLTYITSSLITYIGINTTGGIIQQTSPFTISSDSDYITIGRILHQSGSVTNGASTQPIVSYGTNHWQDDFTRAFGPLKVSGHILAASGSTLGITKTAGDSYVIGRNYTTDPNNPNNITSTTDTAVTVSKIYRAYVSGSTLRLDTGVNNAGYTTINPTQYNNNGTLASVGASEASIQRVYWYPNTVSRAFTVYYGSAVYSDPPGGTNALDVAQQNIASENFVEGENTAGAAILVGYILALGSATNLSNTAEARFIQAGVSRGAGAGGGGGVVAGTTNAAGLDTYVQFNDGGSTFGGDAGLTYNKTTDTLSGVVAQFTTISGSTITGSNITLAGDIEVNGGDITTTATTFNLLNGTATTVNFGGAATTMKIASGSGTSVEIGATTGRTTINNNLAISTGTIIGAPGSGANVMTLISSGNIIARLDTNNDGAGHKFIVQDYLSTERFSAGEDGNIIVNPASSGTGQGILVSGSNTIGGSTYIDFLRATNTSAGAVTPTKTFRLNNSGSFEIVNSGYSSTIYSLDDSGNIVSLGGISLAGQSVLATVSERTNLGSAASGTTTFDTTGTSIFYNSGPTGNITANFTNVPTNSNRTTSVTVILSQSATPRLINVLQVNSTGSGINWANSIIPTPNANKYDVFGFSLIRSGSTWIALGQMSTYG